MSSTTAAAPAPRHSAPLRLYLEFARVTFLKMLAYRLRYYTGIVTYLVFVAGNAFLFRAVYAGLPEGTSVGGYGVEGIITYLAIAWIGRSLTFNNIDRELSSAVTDGQIATNLMKPINFQAMTYFSALGEMGFRLVLFTIPISVVIFPLFGVQGPPTFTAGAAAATPKPAGPPASTQPPVATPTESCPPCEICSMSDPTSSPTSSWSTWTEPAHSACWQFSWRASSRSSNRGSPWTSIGRCHWVFVS